jgi:hypothetical protein
LFEEKTGDEHVVKGKRVQRNVLVSKISISLPDTKTSEAGKREQNEGQNPEVETGRKLS